MGKVVKPVFSVIIPVYNRPQEIFELLESLTKHNKALFEVIVVEDGSQISSVDQVMLFEGKLDIQYLEKENTGQGFSRNYAAQYARGKYLVFFDSDCLIPENYFGVVEKYLDRHAVDAWGGPDKAHENFSSWQKAISFTMTSVLTTGGIRGKKKHVGSFQPRSFNMGIRKDVFLETGGFKQTNLGEDIEYSTRLLNAGYKTALITEAFVYHKRRATPKQFFKQAFSFGKGRVITGRKNKNGIKLIHWFPLLFCLSFLGLPIAYIIHPVLFFVGVGVFGVYFFSIAMWSFLESRSLVVGLLSVFTAIYQLVGYGVGFLIQFIRKSD
ncbi:MAG: glycosyltransferase [Cyclobacteriaceae bacterium]|nr:glycosyltransferase [Cyclobacteriaceae bacterium]